MTLICQGIMDNHIGSTIRHIDLSRNKLLSEHITSICELIRYKPKHLQIINLRDNLIREDIGEALVNALKVNDNIVKLCLDINPIKHVIFKEIEQITKRNLENMKEKECPHIQNEIIHLRKQRDHVLEEYTSIDKRNNNVHDTAEQIKHKILMLQKAKTYNQHKFTKEDQQLEHIKEEEKLLFKMLKKERKALRIQKQDVDFEVEQIDIRHMKKQKQLDKQIEEIKHKIEVVKLAQNKSITERNQIDEQMMVKRNQNQLVKDAWSN